MLAEEVRLERPSSMLRRVRLRVHVTAPPAALVAAPGADNGCLMRTWICRLWPYGATSRLRQASASLELMHMINGDVQKIRIRRRRTLRMRILTYR